MEGHEDGHGARECQRRPSDSGSSDADEPADADGNDVDSGNEPEGDGDDKQVFALDGHAVLQSEQICPDNPSASTGATTQRRFRTFRRKGAD